MPELPSGRITLLFTDIEGSTALWERHPDAMRIALARHDASVSEAIESARGVVFKTVGDAFCAAFSHAADALVAAVRIQRALASADWTMLGEDAPLKTRIGIHSGEVDLRGTDYFGPTVNRVARIEAAGHGGQILMSSTTRSEVEEDGLPEGCSLKGLGEHRLKDLRHSEHLTLLIVPDIPEVNRSPRTAGELHAHDRIQVLGSRQDDGPSGKTVVTRSVSETLAAIEAAVLDDSAGVVLTEAQVREAAGHRPGDWREWRLSRIAEWSQPRFRLDGRFVGLTLLVDKGEDQLIDRWEPAETTEGDLGALFEKLADPAIVLLGPPGSGKSTLLRRFELDTAIEALRSGSDHGRVTFFVPLNTYPSARYGEPPAPAEWLAAHWRARVPALPELDELLSEGRVTLLLDALNEMPIEGDRDRAAQVMRWKAWLNGLVASRPGNRVIFSCRSLDYSQPLSSPDLRVPQIRLEPLSDAQVRRFLALHSPGRWREIWAELQSGRQLDVLRSPYFLALLVDQVEASGEMPVGRAALFTGFVRQALRREVERGDLRFMSGALLTTRDLGRITKWRWQREYDLPERGMLIPKLEGLAYRMQHVLDAGAGSQVRISVDDALDLLDSDEGEAILGAGEAISVLDEDEAAGELMYIHQLVQEFFAARELARSPQPELVRSEWRSDRIRPSVEETIDAIAPSEPLPGLPSRGWEETTILAAAMSDDPAAFISGVMEVNLALAGRAAAQPEIAPRLPADLVLRLRDALVERSRDPAADLRDRIACGHALGELGDPRFQRREGPHGAYLLPPLVEIPAGRYGIGDDQPIAFANGQNGFHLPRHEVTLEAFRIGRFAVTNAEWRCFLQAGGYEDERWWDTEDGRRWRIGIGTQNARYEGIRYWRKKFREDPSKMDYFVQQGNWDANDLEMWQARLAMTDDELDRHMREVYPETRRTEPLRWGDEAFNQPAQPVIGVCWFEARAYVNWLREQSGLPFRLPTEAEWEAAARGRDGRRYAFGDVFERHRCNTLDAHVRRTTPIGVFPDGDTPEGVSDLTGNSWDWTSTAYDPDAGDDGFPYPYAADDGREEPEAPPTMCRVVRGGSWLDDQSLIRTVLRSFPFPTAANRFYGVRVAM